MDDTVHSKVPPTWVEETVGAATSLAAGEGLPVVISASVVRLVKGVLATMFLTKLKALVASLLIVAIAGASAAVLARQDAPASKAPLPGDNATPKFPSHGATPKFQAAEPNQPSTWPARANSPWDIHPIGVPPGAKVHIRVETNDKRMVECEATVRSDGRMLISENSIDPTRESHHQYELTATTILISSFDRSDQPAPKANLPTAPMKTNFRPIRSSPDVSSDHERRLHELERKLDHVLERLESSTQAVRPESPR
jgi:hypothetical protein